MANAAKAFDVIRSADVRTPACCRTNDHSRAYDADDARVLRWFILLPVGAVMIIALLVMSLGKIAPGPHTPSSGVEPDPHVPVPVADELDPAERMMRLGPAVSR